jgi:CubicO group peptidase (beta-lactamase class C family)
MLRLIAILAVAPVACSAQQVAVPESEILQRTARVVEQIIRRPEAVGLSIAVARGDRVLFEKGVGKADLEFDAPVDSRTMFRIGSITKQFTAASIMMLVERGKIHLDDDLHKYVPTFDTGGRVVTIRQLLNHSSGIPNLTDQPGFATDIAPRELTGEPLLATVKGVPFDFEPGKGWNYSNTGYLLLGMIIEAADGRPYDRFMQEELFGPLGLSRTRQGSERDIIANRAQGYSGGTAGSPRRNDALISMTVPGAAGALSSTAGDLVRWHVALVNGRVVGANTFQQMVDSAVATHRGDVRYGLGLQVEGAQGASRISHSGSIQGFNSVLHFLPESGLHVAVISNSETLPSSVVAEQLLAAITDNARPASINRTSPKDGAEAALRRFIEEAVRGEPDYSRMAARFEKTFRGQQQAAQAGLQALGAVESATFVDVDVRGNDVFHVQFANGSKLLFIGLDDTGKITAAGMRPGAPTPAK